MLRQMLAALATLAFVVTGPAVIAPQAPTALTFGVAEAKKTADKKAADEEAEDEEKGKGADKKRRIAHNKKVGLNETTLVFHDKTCRHYTKKLAVVTAKEAKAKGGKPCKVCLK